MKLISKLIIIITLVLSGCASKPTDPQDVLKDNMQVMRNAVSDVVKDVQRRNNLLALTKTLETTLLAYNQAYTDFAIEFGKQNRKYNTPRAKLETLLTSFRNTRETAMSEVVKLHFDMVAQTTADEWKRIVKHEIKAIKTVREQPNNKSGEKS